MTTYVYAPPPYPIPSLPLVVREAASEIQFNIQAPDALVAMSLLGAMSLACQGLIDVKLPTGQIRPCSLNLLCVGESGERKSTVDRLVLSPFYANDVSAIIAYKAALQDYHDGKRSTHPFLRRFIRQNLNERSLMEALDGDGESIAVLTDEGDSLFKSSVMRCLGTLNRLWDGAPLLTIDRPEFDHVLVMNPRVSVSIMTQPVPLREYIHKRGALTRGSGHWARYLVGWPMSTQGSRNVIPTELTWICLPYFLERMSELLAQYRAMVEAGAIARDAVEFSDGAKARWFDLAARTEWLVRPGEYLSDVPDFAAKVMEIIGRLSAVFHHVSRERGKIALDTLERAYAVMQWHVAEFKRLFAPQLVIPQDQADAQAIARYLRYGYWRGLGSNSMVAKNVLLQNGPVRHRDRLNAALAILFSMQAITIEAAEKTKQKFVKLCDPFFASFA